jgi:predicted Rdx family selenoprotein
LAIPHAEIVWQTEHCGGFPHAELLAKKVVMMMTLIVIEQKVLIAR